MCGLTFLSTHSLIFSMNHACVPFDPVVSKVIECGRKVKNKIRMFFLLVIGLQETFGIVLKDC